MYSYNFDHYGIHKTNINHETHFKIHFDVTAQVDFNSKPTSIIKPTSIMKHNHDALTWVCGTLKSH